MKKTVVVLGGGPTGLTAAYTLAKKSFNVVVIEKNDFLGGLSATFPHEDYLLDYGPHNLHTDIPRIIKFIEEEVGVPLLRLPSRPAKIYFQGKIIDYPINIFNALTKINWGLSIRCLLDYLYARASIKLMPDIQETSFADWVKNRFGKYLFDLYFGPYAEKVWGVPASLLDASIASKRIPEPSLLSVFIRTLTGFKIGKRHSEDPHLNQSYYPLGGIGKISEKLAHSICCNAGTIELNARISHIHTKGLHGGAIEYLCNGRTHTIEWDYLINTIPIPAFVDLIKTPGTDILNHDIHSLSYRATIFLYLFISSSKATDYPWIYFNDKTKKDLIFNRMYDIGSYSPDLVPPNRGVVCLEISCYKNDSIWNKNDSELYETCVSFLEKNKLLTKNTIQSTMTKRVAETYPVFKTGFAQHVKKIIDFFSKRSNIILLGRQGLFTYTNIDHCIDMGLRTEQLVHNNSIDLNKFASVYKDYLPD